MTASFTNGVLSIHSVTISNTGSLFTIMATRTGGTETGVSNAFDVSSKPIVATKFRIQNPLDVQVGQSTTITIEAVDDSGNRDDSFHGSINLVLSGDATGAGLINIINGVGTKTISDLTVETVNLSLANIVPPTTLDFADTENIIFSAVPPIPSSGGSTGGGGPVTPSISFTGRAFPEADMKLVAVQNGQVPITNGSVSSSGGNFNVKYNGILPSTVNSFALVVYDKDKNIVQTKIFKLGANNQFNQTVLMAPTVYLNQPTVTRGTFTGITGLAMPNYKIELMIDGVKTPETVKAKTDGSYNLVFNTDRLDLGTHTLRVRQVDNKGQTSDYSIEKSFMLIKFFTPKADLNNDGKLDATDWSIFLVRYRSTDPKVRQTIDLNGDGKTDQTDLSLFLEAFR